MNTNHAAPTGSKETFIDTEASHTSLGTEQPEPGLKHLSQPAPGNKPAPQLLTDYTITKAEQPATVQGDLATRFQVMCTNDDGTTLASILSGMSEEEVSTWLNTALPYSERHDTPMMYVARRNCASMTAVLMSHKADPVAINPHSETASHPLYIAAQENNVDVIRVMSTADTFAVDTPRGDGSSALFAAVGNQSLKATKFLLECNADPNYKLPAINLDGDLRPAQYFTEDEAARGKKCWSTLMNVAAAQEQTDDSVKILELLLCKGGKVENVDPCNSFQQSPLSAAIISAALNVHNCENIVDLLLSHGADMYEPMPILLDDVSPAENSQSAVFINTAKLTVRPSICEYSCFFGYDLDVFSFVKIIHKYYLAQEGSEKIPLKEFVEVNASEGFTRSVATFDAFKGAVFPPCVNGMGYGNQRSLLEELCAMDASGITCGEREASFAASLVLGAAALAQKGKKDGT